MELYKLLQKAKQYKSQILIHRYKDKEYTLIQIDDTDDLHFFINEEEVDTGLDISRLKEKITIFYVKDNIVTFITYNYLKICGFNYVKNLMRNIYTIYKYNIDTHRLFNKTYDILYDFNIYEKERENYNNILESVFHTTPLEQLCNDEDCQDIRSGRIQQYGLYKLVNKYTNYTVLCKQKYNRHRDGLTYFPIIEGYSEVTDYTFESEVLNSIDYKYIDELSIIFRPQIKKLTIDTLQKFIDDIDYSSNFFDSSALRVLLSIRLKEERDYIKYLYKWFPNLYTLTSIVTPYDRNGFDYINIGVTVDADSSLEITDNAGFKVPSTMLKNFFIAIDFRWDKVFMGAIYSFNKADITLSDKILMESRDVS